MLKSSIILSILLATCHGRPQFSNEEFGPESQEQGFESQPPDPNFGSESLDPVSEEDFQPRNDPRQSERLTLEEFNFINDPYLYPEESHGDDVHQDEAQGRAAGYTDPAFHWTDGVVYYSLADFVHRYGPQYHKYFIRNLQSAFGEIEARTCIRFIDNTMASPKSPDFLNITDDGDESCWSYIGKRGKAQRLALGRGCHAHATILHELIHAIGFDHQQNRPDREDHVAIVTQNIEDEYQGYFKLKNISGTFDTEYDFESVMHFDARAYGKHHLGEHHNEQRITILPHDMGLLNVMGRRDQMSYGDWRGIANMYCPNFTRFTIQLDHEINVHLHGSGYVEDAHAVEAPQGEPNTDHMGWFYDAALIRNGSIGSRVCNWESQMRQKTCLSDTGTQLVYAPGHVDGLLQRWHYYDAHGPHYRKIQNLGTRQCIEEPKRSSGGSSKNLVRMIDCDTDDAWWYVYTW